MSSLSFSSSSSHKSFLSDEDSHIFIPNKTRSFSGIPFSWEKLPGIPKRQLSEKIEDPSLDLLPLPPSTGTPTPSKKSNTTNFRKDPFFAALVECSKDDDDDDDDDDKGGDFFKRSGKLTRSLSDRFGFVSMYASCKRSCPIADSVISVPKPRNYLIKATRKNV